MRSIIMLTLIISKRRIRNEVKSIKVHTFKYMTGGVLLIMDPNAIDPALIFLFLDKF